MFCTNCGSQNEPGTTFCTKCGAKMGADAIPGQAGQAPPLEAAPGFAPHLGASTQIPGGLGTPPYPDPTAKSKLAAGLLGIFLGGLGIHRFYLGYTNIGIAQLATDMIGWILLPFTCGISLVFIVVAHVWGLVDGIMILAGSINRDAQGKPLRD